MERKQANRVSVITIIINLLLSLMKFVAGFIGHSQAMISDAVHSASDVVSTIAVIFGVNMSMKKSDDDHPYGHERIESIFSIILAMMLFATGMGIGLTAIKTIINGSEIVIPGKIALGAAIVSIAVKEWMYHYTKHTAVKINSSSMLADAWHHRSDALSSVGSLIGVAGAILGFPICEPIASIIICIFIAKAAADIFFDSVNRLVDRACTDEEIEKIKACITEIDGVMRIDKLMTRRFGSKIYVDLEIAEDGDISLNEAHRIAEAVHDNIENKIENIKHCMIHVNPF
ncbi:MAG: cation diffusion facilitator family transporter [Clostridia bacterium]|jgi:cation diffusion facilitator family transporter|nr:cation diffusion facilitator family transporter [Clostridia bacterium]